MIAAISLWYIYTHTFILKIMHMPGFKENAVNTIWICGSFGWSGIPAILSVLIKAMQQSMKITYVAFMMGKELKYIYHFVKNTQLHTAAVTFAIPCSHPVAFARAYHIARKKFYI